MKILALLLAAALRAQDGHAPVVKIEAEDLADSAAAADWWQLARMRKLFGNGATALAHDAGPNEKQPEYAFLAISARGGQAVEIRRSAVLLRFGNMPEVLITFDLVVSSEAISPCWNVSGLKPLTLLPAAGELRIFTSQGHTEMCATKARQETVFLNVMHLAEHRLPVLFVQGEDLAGVRAGDRVVMFHMERNLERKPVSFEVKNDAKENGKLKYLVTGLAPGTWEIWRDGFLENPEGAVERRACALYFEGPPASYYFKNPY